MSANQLRYICKVGLGMSATELDFRMQVQKDLKLLGVDKAEILFVETKFYLDQKIREKKLREMRK